MTADEAQQQQCERQNYWRCLKGEELLTVLEALDPDWFEHFCTYEAGQMRRDPDRAIAFYQPDYDFCKEALA